MPEVLALAAVPSGGYLPSFMLLVFTTFPEAGLARETAALLLQEGLAACVTLLPAAESHYIWEGRLEVASEVPVIIKTTEEAYDQLEVRLRALHPYRVPELVAVPVSRGSAPYLEWVRQACRR